MKYGLRCLVAVQALAWAQQPVINPNGVVNAASYTTGIGDLSRNPAPQTGGGPALMEGSLASIFGVNLATGTLAAQTPLPRQLLGTSVSVNGIAAPLLFVSPNQINFQVPSGTDTTSGASSAAGVVVSTAAGQSAPYPLGMADSPGIFTRDSSGCGRGAVLNVAADGGVSVNSPANSAAPGAFVSIYGTGNGFVNNAPPDGAAAPADPLATSPGGAGPLFDFAAGGDEGRSFWVGRAPGLVGVDQFNFLLPATVRQGCAVPLQILNDNLSPPVTISIAKGGGACSDPPAQGYGQILWEKRTTFGENFSTTSAETLTVSLQSSPGREAPAPINYTEGGVIPGSYTYFGPACVIPGYKSLDAGSISAQGPGIAPVATRRSPLTGGTVVNIQPEGGFTLAAQTQSSQAAGMTVYQADLPEGTIKAGSFTVSASGGADVGAFQSTVQIGAPIQVVTALASRVLHNSDPPLQIQWTGGDANSWVTVRLVGHFGGHDYSPSAWAARASDGQIAIQGATNGPGFGILGPAELVIEVTPDPSQVSLITAPNLSLGGRAQWKYSYYFEGVLVEQ